MSKKIDSFRRVGSRETICSISDSGSNNNNNNNCTTSNNNNNRQVTSKLDQSLPDIKQDAKQEKRIPGTFHRSPSPFKSFFIRMGSTGMLNSAKSGRRSQTIDDRLKTSEKENLFRSCSTSQLNTSLTYVKGDDPSEGIDLQISSRKDKTVSCDDLARQNVDAFDDHLTTDTTASLYPLGSPSVSSFSSCDFEHTRNESPMRKSNSCDFKETKKSSFPYAFLRSKLSVLPEERHSTFASKDERLFKTASEEHFPTLKIEDTYTGTTTLGRRRSRTGNFPRGNPSKSQSRESKAGFNGYAEFRKSSSRCEQDRFSLNPSQLERIDDHFQQEDVGCYSSYDCSPMSLRGNIHQTDPSQERIDFVGKINESRFSETSSLNVDLDMVPTLRNHRRNSAPSGEQRLSSHYVSSNESGYDSDGPRGESAAASENEGLSLKCTDSSDTSSVVDSELEKPIRSSTPSECQDQENNHDARTKENSDSVRERNSELADGIDGFRWHQSNSGRLLPSIHQTYDDAAMNSQFLPAYRNGLNGLQSSPPKSLDISPHRARLQQDKSRFLSDIIQPPKRVRRCRLVQLHKRDPKESLGIRLAQQRLGELRYIVVQLESDGIAHRDGRLRLGDEIVEVEGKELSALDSLEEVQDFLKSFTGNKIRLITAYEETVPQVYVSPPTLLGEYEYLENAKNLSSLSLIDGQTKQCVQSEKSGKTAEDDVIQSTKRPDFLPLSCSTKERKSAENGLESTTEPQHYSMRHIAKFEKGYGKPSLGFSVVGGRDSPRGEMGIFVRRVFPGGQADVSKSLFQGDEILSLNGKILRGYTHQEVIELFKAVREGPIELEVMRRHRYPKSAQKSAAC
ncbi:uncharacterized protein LOC144471381 isoform X2 [Augochlora pura]